MKSIDRDTAIHLLGWSNAYSLGFCFEICFSVNRFALAVAAR